MRRLLLSCPPPLIFSLEIRYLQEQLAKRGHGPFGEEVGLGLIYSWTKKAVDKWLRLGKGDSASIVEEYIRDLERHKRELSRQQELEAGTPTVLGELLGEYTS